MERLLRATRLITIWTGTSEIMGLVIRRECHRGLGAQPPGRDVEQALPTPS